MNQNKLLISVYAKAMDAECALDELMEAVREYKESKPEEPQIEEEATPAA